MYPQIMVIPIFGSYVVYTDESAPRIGRSIVCEINDVHIVVIVFLFEAKRVTGSSTTCIISALEYPDSGRCCSRGAIDGAIFDVTVRTARGINQHPACIPDENRCPATRNGTLRGKLVLTARAFHFEYRFVGPILSGVKKVDPLGKENCLTIGVANVEAVLRQIRTIS